MEGKNNKLTNNIITIVIGAVITSVLGLNAYYQKSSTEAIHQNTNSVNQMNKSFLEFKTEQIKDNEFVNYKLQQHDNVLNNHERRIDCVELRLYSKPSDTSRFFKNPNK